MSDGIRIKCNNVPRPVLGWGDLTSAERAEFDYIDSEAAQDEACFFRYRKVCYDLGDFCTINRLTGLYPGLELYDGYNSDSFFSGVLVRFLDSERVIAATFYS